MSVCPSKSITFIIIGSVSGSAGNLFSRPKAWNCVKVSVVAKRSAPEYKQHSLAAALHPALIICSSENAMLKASFEKRAIAHYSQARLPMQLIPQYINKFISKGNYSVEEASWGKTGENLYYIFVRKSRPKAAPLSKICGRKTSSSRMLSNLPYVTY